MTDVKQPEPPRNPIPRLDGRLQEAMRNAAKEINEAQPLRPNEPPEHRFMTVSDRLCDLILETAKQQLLQAENNLKRAEREVEAIRERSKSMWDVIEGFQRELVDYSNSAMEIHERFVRKGK